MSDSLKSKFSPGWVLTTCVAAALAILLWLGFWQLERLEEKTHLIASIEASLTATPVALPEDLTTIADYEYKRVLVKAKTAQASNACVFGRNSKGEVGLFYMVPVELEDGQIIFVNFDWESEKVAKENITEINMGDRLCPSLDSYGMDLIVNGIVRLSSKGNMVTPEPDLENAIWYNADVISMGKAFKLASAVPFFLDAIIIEDSEDKTPRESLMQMNLPNDHLQYAMTWFGLAIVLIGVYIAFGMQRARKITKT